MASAPFMAEEFGQQQRSGSSIIPIAKSCFPNMAGGGTAKTDVSLEICVSSVLAVPIWPFCAVAAFARSAQVITAPPP